MRQLSLLVLFACLSVGAHAMRASAVQQPAATMQVGAIEVSGAKRYTAVEVIRLSGLRVGQTTAKTDLDAAMQRMAATGLFKQLNYRYATLAGRATITLEIEESDWTMPVVFDNFIWFKDEEIIAALRTTIPSFDGTAPTTAGIPELIARELQAFLGSRRMPGQVDFVPQGTLKTGIESFVFKVTNPATKLCTVAFAGASAIKEAELAAVFQPVIGTDYSRAYVAATARGTLTDLYRRRGHWQARIGAPVATVVQDASCSGAAVTLAVDEGVPYTWERAEWSGNASLDGKALDTLVPLKRGDVASIQKIDDGMRQVTKAYGKQGYIQQRATYTPRLDNTSRTAVFEIRVDEGPQFRAGTVEFPGLAPKDADSLSKKWQLRPGDVFDMSYLERFYFDEIVKRLPPTVKVDMQPRADVPNRIVNVRFVFGQ